jgi:arylsulfatase A-like enzyme
LSGKGERPSILIILADDHGYGDASCYDGPNIQTPNIDRIASEGIRFTRFYANSSVCSPSRASLMTGRYPDRVGVPGVIRTHLENSWGYLSPDAVTLPQMLSKAGYRNHIIGKWHLGLEPENHPCRRGFDRFKGFLGDMMDDYYTHLRHGYNYMREGQREIDPEGHATDLFTEWAIETLEAERGSEDPFFLYLAYNAPHTPIQPPEEWIERVREREPDASQERVTYAALVEHMDNGIGRVLDALDGTGQGENTIVFYTSDNGGYLPAGASNGWLRGNKGDMYEGGIRVPACARWPGYIPRKITDDHVCMLMDLFPTACEIAGLDPVQGIEADSILPEILGEPEKGVPERTLYWVRRDGYPRFLGLCQHAVRRGDVKLLHNGPFEPLELFDMGADEAEERDISSSELETFRDMTSLLKEEIRVSGSVPWQRPR